MTNRTPEMYDDTELGNKPTQEEILMNESDILDGILNLGKRKDESENYRKIRLKDSKGAVKLEFRIRPISEDENRALMKKATPATKDKNIRVETNWVKYRSLLIYSATVDEDRIKIWDNPRVKEAMNVYEAWELIDKVMLAGEKAKVIDIIDEASGFGLEESEAEETSKN